MTDEEMFEKIWFAYPNDLCKGKKGGKTPAKQALKKLKLTEQEFNKVILNMTAQARQDRNEPDAYRWPFISTYLNQRRYDDWEEKPEKPVYQSATCSHNGCNNEVHGPKFSVCAYHVLPNDDIITQKLRQKYKDLGLIRQPGETKEQHLARCKAIYKQGIGNAL